ncbi:hypothetical protein [Peribacillus sp. CSMR9]
MVQPEFRDFVEMKEERGFSVVHQYGPELGSYFDDGQKLVP